MGARAKHHRTAVRPVSPTVLIAALALAAVAGPGGCGSIYHEIARREPGGLEQRLELRRGEAIRAHENALASIERIVADLREERHTRTRAGRIERMRDERLRAQQMAWRARKSIASIEDVIVLDDEGRIAPPDSDAAARQIVALENASNEIDAALALVVEGVDTFAANGPDLGSITTRITQRLGEAHRHVETARGLSAPSQE